jgi:hypothetical protein
MLLVGLNSDSQVPPAGASVSASAPDNWSAVRFILYRCTGKVKSASLSDKNAEIVVFIVEIDGNSGGGDWLAGCGALCGPLNIIHSHTVQSILNEIL